MKHLIIALPVVLCMATLGFGREWRPFVGISGLLDFQTETNTLIHPFRVRFNPIYVSPGTQFDLGIRSRNHEVYAAYHLSNSHENSYGSGVTTPINDSTYKSEYWHNADSRAERRILFGYRYHPVSSEKAMLAPIVGGALTVGRSGYRVRESHEEIEYTTHPSDSGVPYDSWVIWQYSAGITLSTPVNIGAMVEIGVSASVWNGMQILLLTQVHYFEAHFIEREYWQFFGPNKFYMIVPSGMLQLRYVFR